MDSQPKQPQGLMPLGLGLLLWGTSALLTLALFWGLSGVEWWMKAIAAAWAVGLEGTKILSWRLGGRYRWLAGALVAVTLFSVWGLAVGSVEGQIQKNETVRSESTNAYRDARRSIDDLQAQIGALVTRLTRIPDDFVTATNQLNQEIQRLRDRLEAKQEELSTGLSVGALDESSTDPFSVLAAALGWPRRSVVIFILMMVALLTEISAFAMVGYRPMEHSSSQPVTTLSPSAPTEEDYLRVALDHPNAPRLLGRLEVARRLGIHENQARNLLQGLIDTGRVKRSAKSFEALITDPPKRHPKPPAAS